MKAKQGETAKFVLCVILILLLFLCPDEASDGIKRGLAVCSGTLIPSLFPFMVISEMLVRSGLGIYAARYLGKPMKKIFGVSGGGAGALILGILCGFPIGAKTAAALYIKGDISKNDAEQLMAFCNFPSAPFMIFAVGEGMFGDKKIGILIYISVLMSGLACGIAGRFFQRKSIVTGIPVQAHKGAPLSHIFTESVTNAASALISVCAYVTFFTCFVSCISAFLSESAGMAKALLFSLFELTSGASACAALNCGSAAILLCSCAAGWSGLSVFFQISSITHGISMKPYLLSKAFSAVLSPLITLSALKIFPDIIPKTPTSTDVFFQLRLYPAAFIRAVNMIFILSLVFYLIKLLDRRAPI